MSRRCEQFVRCKDTIKPRAKTNLFVFCRGGVSTTKSKITIKPRAKTNLFVFCRGGVSTTKSKITIKPRAKTNLFAFCYPGGVKNSENREKMGTCSHFSEAHSMSKIKIEKERAIVRARTQRFPGQILSVTKNITPGKTKFVCSTGVLFIS